MLLLCAAVRLAHADGCPDTHAWTGRVKNWSYGFTFVVPVGLQAYWNSARCVDDAKEGCTCMSDHGRIMSLGAKPAGVDRQMEMYADFGAEYETGKLAEVVKSVERCGNRAGATKCSTRNTSYRLGGLRARWVQVRYTDAQTGIPMVRDEVVAYRSRKSSVLYQPYLLTPARDLVQDEPKFRAMVRSFRVTKGEY